MRDFSDAANPSARGALRALQWPVENSEVDVNNAAFTIELDAQNAHKFRDWWLLSVKGQFRLLQMLLRMPPMLTAASAFVTQDRLELERKCELAERKILRTANDAQNLITNLEGSRGVMREEFCKRSAEDTMRRKSWHAVR